MKIKKLATGEQPMTAGAGGSMSMDDSTKRTIIILSVIALVGGLAIFMWLGRTATAQEPTPTKPPIRIETVAPLETPAPIADAPSPTPTTPLEPAQIAGTATAMAMYSRPAMDPASSPYYVGVITYESGCPITNMGFTTAGYEGEPFYLYLNQMLDRDPLFQVVQIKGVIQNYDDCPLPVLFATDIFWMSQQATPAPVSVITNTATITGTITPTPFNPATWGMKPGTPNAPTAGQSLGAAVVPTYTPYPSPTSPPPTRYPTYTPYPRPSNPTATPQPTATPSPTATATPQTASVYGKITAVGGCTVSNFAVSNGEGHYFIIFAGAQTPATDPTQYAALVIGTLEPACGGQAIKAHQILWYEPTPTPTTEPTATSEPTTEPTTEAAAE